MQTRTAAREVLVIDDAPEHRDLLREIFEEEGYCVTLAEIPDLVEVRRRRPDVLVLNYLFAGEPAGADLLEDLRRDPATACLPVVVCTGAAEAVLQRIDPSDTPGLRVVRKPFIIEDLLGALDAAWREARDFAPPAGD